MPKVTKALFLASITAVSTLVLWLGSGMTLVRQNFDGPYYAVVAKTLYNKSEIGNLFSFPLPQEYYAAHFPAFPLLMRALAYLHINYLDAGLIISLLFSIGVVLLLYKISDSFWVGLAWLFFWPRMWVIRSIVSPETMFILFCLLSVFLFKHKKYFWAGLTGAVATLTKSPGILLFGAYGLWGLIEFIKTKKIHWNIYPILLIPISLLLLFTYYHYRTGDFWAYFHSGDNIHLQVLPFRIFDSTQPWVGDFWLEDVVWIYLFGGLGVYYLLKKDWVMGIFPAIFYIVILFVSHRDISRYALPIAPFVLMGMSRLFDRKEIQVALVLLIIPAFLYSLNFLAHNQVIIANWSPFFAK